MTFSASLMNIKQRDYVTEQLVNARRELWLDCVYVCVRACVLNLLPQKHTGTRAWQHGKALHLHDRNFQKTLNLREYGVKDI